MSVMPQVIPTTNGIFNNQPFGANVSQWGVIVEQGNWNNADSQLGGSLQIDLTGLSAYTLSAEEAVYGYIRFIGTPAGVVTLTVPNQGREYIFNNTTSASINIIPYAGTGAMLAGNLIGLFRVDMTQSEAVGVLFVSPINPLPALLIEVSSDYEITGTDALSKAIIEVDATAGEVIITYPPALVVGYQVTVAKIDASANAVLISPDGSTPVASITTPINAGQVSSLIVWSNGTDLRCSAGVS